MKIIYVAQHGGHDNDDEGAIADGLTQLGHQVERVEERDGRLRFMSRGAGADFLLFHKWHDFGTMFCISIPKVFWFFDLVDGRGDPMLESRSVSRMAWIHRAMEQAAVGFCTDGDWAARHHEKMVHLPQGADQRILGRGTHTYINNRPPILFTGTPRHGTQRMNHIKHLRERWGEQLEVLGDGGPHTRVHGRQLANAMAGRIVIAPDGPQTDRYWSNRVYQALGFGAMLLHPYCAMLGREFISGRDLQFYQSWLQCDNLIQYLLHRPRERDATGEQGLRTITENYTYKHRCQTLIDEVQKRIKK